jgi:D-glycerate 3-kinase
MTSRLSAIIWSNMQICGSVSSPAWSRWVVHKGHSSVHNLISPALYKITPSPSDELNNILKWKLQAEHSMKAANGGHGMSDGQLAQWAPASGIDWATEDPDIIVPSHLERFIPAYIFFETPSTHVTKTCQPQWQGKGLKMVVDENRNAVETGKF